ncbi:hypothetical protein D910_11233 [Dendroctonus ponderosae]|uniref:Uncharacterized protein n=1 Tax=Dendroctonus ponderosae TaxID=77166 RepID=U4ULF4_DENPD|nr:hypothetical protein D910_11233 [Dendroctonus ponderosae]
MFMLIEGGNQIFKKNSITENRAWTYKMLKELQNVQIFCNALTISEKECLMTMTQKSLKLIFPKTMLDIFNNDLSKNGKRKVLLCYQM